MNGSLVNSMWTPLAAKAAAVARWYGYSRGHVDAAIQAAQDDGTIAGYEDEVRRNPFLDLVFIPYRESVPTTLVYLLNCAMGVWGEDHPCWKEAYDEGVDENRVKLIDRARPFTRNRLALVAVDFGANWNQRDGTVLRDVQASQAPILEDFGVLANAVQSPGWIRRMDGVKVPHAIAAALLLKVPGDHHEWVTSPDVFSSHGRLGLHGSGVDSRLQTRAMPVRREYPR